MNYTKVPTSKSRAKQLQNKTVFPSGPSSQDGPMAAFIRPQSANQRKPEFVGVSTDRNFRQMLQQKV